ncbi:MAG: WG repeat-containing protein [Acidobacteria bacterium]|nr:WG repeat-containing protein [Acidobacteriota bacterium]
MRRTPDARGPGPRTTFDARLRARALAVALAAALCPFASGPPALAQPREDDRPREPRKFFPVDEYEGALFLDREGRVRIPLGFDYAAPFSGGLAAVDRAGDGQTGTDAYIDAQGRVVWEKKRR